MQPEAFATFLAELARTGTYDATAAPLGVIAGADHFFFDPPHDARALAELWGLERPIAVSTDVHQHSWWLFERGPDLDDPYGRRVVALPVRFGSLVLAPRLTARPSGPSPGVVAGASPAYDVLEVGGLVDLVQVRRR